MRRWHITLIGTVIGLLMALWMTTLSENTTPDWIRPAFKLTYGIAARLGEIFIGRSEWDGMMFVIPLLFLLWPGIGALGGSLIGTLAVRNREKQKNAQPGA